MIYMITSTFLGCTCMLLIYQYSLAYKISHQQSDINNVDDDDYEEIMIRDVFD